jgi:hypothetical protein
MANSESDVQRSAASPLIPPIGRQLLARLAHRLVLGHVSPHKLPYHLSRRPILGTTDLKEIVTQLALNPYAKSGVFACHCGSVANGYTFA